MVKQGAQGRIWWEKGGDHFLASLEKKEEEKKD